MKKIYFLFFIVLTVYIVTSAQENTERIEPLLIPTEGQRTAEIREVFEIDLKALERYNEGIIYWDRSGSPSFPGDIAKVPPAYIASSTQENTEKKEQTRPRTEEQIIAEIREVFEREIEAFEKYREWRIKKHSIAGSEGGDTDFPYDFAKVSSAISRIKKNRAVWEYENAITVSEKVRRGKEALELYEELCQNLTKLTAEASRRYNHGILRLEVMVNAQIERSEAFIEKLIFEKKIIRQCVDQGIRTRPRH